MEPRKLDLRIWHRGRSEPIWCYDSPPEGMVPARGSDLYRGRPVLYQVRIGPDAGSYYTDFVRDTTLQLLLQMIYDGVPVFVRPGR